MLRYPADIKTLASLVAATALFVVQWRGDQLDWRLYVPYLYLSIAASAIAHNHNHVRTWTSRPLNWATDIWITLIYGFPVFAWIPTHNKNHHKYNNAAPDTSRTWRYWEANNVFTLLSYPAISSFFQQGLIGAYLSESRRTNRLQYWEAVSQSAILLLWIAGAFLLDWKKALVFVVIPQQVSLGAVLCFNYIQHVHADEEDAWNHSRNFTGGLLNALLFNNGFHTIHHLRPGLHWSAAPAAHRAIAANIDSTLNERSLAWYLTRTYLLAPFIPGLRRSAPRATRTGERAGA